MGDSTERIERLSRTRSMDRGLSAAWMLLIGGTLATVSVLAGLNWLVSFASALLGMLAYDVVVGCVAWWRHE